MLDMAYTKGMFSGDASMSFIHDSPMTKPLPSLDALHAFEAAARLESFKLAAAELNLTATAISHRIRKLEDDLGCALFTRRVRAVTLTQAGQQLLNAVQSGLATITSAVADIRQPTRHVVTLSVTPELAAHWLVPRLAAFQRHFPHIDLHVHASYQPVDLQAGAADLAIRYSRGPFPGLDTTVLFEEHFAPVASPALKAGLHADPRQWPLIHMDWHHKALAQDWATWAQTAGLAPADMQGGLRYSDGSHAVQAAMAGHGVALLGLSLLQAPLRLGLLEVVAEPVLTGQPFHLCHAQRRTLSPAARQLRDCLLAWARESELPPRSMAGYTIVKPLHRAAPPARPATVSGC